MNSQARNFLNGLVSKVRAKYDLDKPHTIVCGDIAPCLQEYFFQSQLEGVPILLDEQIGGVSIFVNAQEEDYKIFRGKEKFEFKASEKYKVVDEKGYVWHMSKTKAKQRGLIK